MEKRIVDINRTLNILKERMMNKNNSYIIAIENNEHPILMNKESGDLSGFKEFGIDIFTNIENEDLWTANMIMKRIEDKFTL